MKYVFFLLLNLAVVPGPESNLSDLIKQNLPKSWSVDKRINYADTLEDRIKVEAKRRGLDPIALAAVGWIESNYWTWATRQDGRYKSVGIWQLIRGDTGPKAAAERLSGCPYTAKAKAWARRLGAPKGQCEAPEVAARRYRPSGWSLSHKELRDIHISTYTVALEIDIYRRKIKKWQRRRRWKHPGCKLNDTIKEHLWEIAHFNRPGRPTRLYQYKLCKYYRRIAKYGNNQTQIRANPAKRRR